MMGEYLVIGNHCTDTDCRLGDATVRLILHVINYTISPHQD